MTNNTQETRASLVLEYSDAKNERQRLQKLYNSILSKIVLTNSEMEQLKKEKKSMLHPNEFVSILTGYAFSTKEEKMFGYHAISEACKWHNGTGLDIDRRIESCKMFIKSSRLTLADIDFDIRAADRRMYDCRKKLKQLN